MLVLTRKKGQSLVIGRDIRVVVVEVSGDFVRLGIEAPPEVAVFREEIYRDVQEENRTALVTRELAARLRAQVENKNEKAACK
ncbi:carbon storage regulator CsrA [Desulfofundulus sp. TPOSR]|uniref:carbon storage regulator CsrA n=1 Tax=Desulfofundulus sp. TPOSR TaxID=2714340 RepID=UPI00140C8B3A|nr:carbon storage regulator CsrA [Desulfofundulus sp. TPOSR]NHM28179.1 carbon storage regulator CsrA [Desulfofundulus sp. TPOSR]